jgi:type I restriction enzyme R subunit
MAVLARKVNEVVADKTRYPDWNNRDDIKAELKVDLIVLLDEHNYHPVDRNEVYSAIFRQVENLSKHQTKASASTQAQQSQSKPI